MNKYNRLEHPCSILRYGFGQASGPALMSGDVEESQDSMPNSAKYIDTASIMAGPGEHGCPRCGGQVFHAEQMFSKGNIYHKVRGMSSYQNVLLIKI